MISYKKITHNSLLPLLKQKSRKKIMGNSEETMLIFGSTFYKSMFKYRKLPANLLLY